MKETLSYDDVTLAPAYSDLRSRSEANPQMFNFDLPIIGSCMDTLGVDICQYLISHNMMFIAHRAFKTAEEQLNYFVPEINNNFEFKYPDANKYKNLWFAVGSVQKYKDWIDYLFEHGVRQFCIDMAHGDSLACVETIKYIKNLYFDELIKWKNRIPGQHLHIIAGNVATASGFKRLQKAGANGIRVGIASGSICSTNIETRNGFTGFNINY